VTLPLQPLFPGHGVINVQLPEQPEEGAPEVVHQQLAYTLNVILAKISDIHAKSDVFITFFYGLFVE
jgi:hypothetical protein